MRLNREDGDLVDGPGQALDTIVLDDDVFFDTGEGMNASGIEVILETTVTLSDDVLRLKKSLVRPYST